VPVARQKTIARPLRDLVEARHVIAKRVPRLFCAKRGQAAVG